MNKHLSLLFFVLLCFTLKSTAQVQIFHETFGTPSGRETSPYTPKGLNSYKFADPSISGSNPNSGGDAREIENNYYAVVTPKNIYTSVQAVNPSWVSGWEVWDQLKLQPDGSGDMDGGVMVVNAGTTIASLYNRPAVLEGGHYYKLSYRYYVQYADFQLRTRVYGPHSSTSSVVDLLSTRVTTNEREWKTQDKFFYVPLDCDGEKFTFSLENAIAANNGFDFAIDDIILTDLGMTSPVTTESIGEITCGVVAQPKAENDESLNNVPGSTVTVPNILGNDFLNLNEDPAARSNVDIEVLLPAGFIAKPFTPNVWLVAGEGEWQLLNGDSWSTEPYAFRFIPEAGFTVNPTPIAYSITDKSNTDLVSDPAYVIITYVGNPTPSDDEKTVSAGYTSVSINILENDKAIDGSTTPTSSSVSVTLKSPEDGSLSNSQITVNGEGTWTYDAGVLTFSPLPNFTSEPTPITYTITENGKTSGPATVTIHVNDAPAPNPSITLVKTASVNTAQTEITYTFTVKNTGNVTLTNVAVTDAKFPGGITLQETTLDAGESTTGTAVYTVTPEDVTAGSVTNTATVTGTPPTGSPVSDISGTEETNDDPTVVPLSNPSITLVKTASVNTAQTEITYTFTVKNTGNVILTGVTVTDAKFSSGITLDETTLDAGESTTGTAVYTVTPEDVTAGSVTNTATASGTPPTGSPVSDISGTEETNDTPTVVPLSNPSITLVKTASVNTAQTEITYTFTVKNTGNVTLTNVAVTDAKFPGGITLDETTLAAGESTTGTAVYTVIPEDVTAGSVTNTATVTGTPPTGSPISDISGTEETNDTPTVVPLSNPSITLVKTASVNTAQTEITYTFTVKNTGNVTLTGVTVTDAKFPGGITLQETTLDAGESTSGTAVYTVTPEDVTAGSVTNTATVTGAPPTGSPVSDISGTEESNDDPTVVPLTPQGAFDLSLSMVVSPGQAAVFKRGETVKFTITVSNNGDIDATNINLINYIPQGLTLAPGGAWEMQGSNAVLINPITGLDSKQSTEIEIEFLVDNLASNSVVNKAEILSADGGTDINSTPGNNVDGEDDIDTANIKICETGKCINATVERVNK